MVNRNGKKSDNLKSKISKCSKLKRAISHKILRKTSNKANEDKTNTSSVLLISIIDTKTDTNNPDTNKLRKCESFLRGNLVLQPLDLVIEEARIQLSLEKLREKKMEKFRAETYLSNYSCCQATDESYEEMELLQTFYNNIYDGDYMDMGFV